MAITCRRSASGLLPSALSIGATLGALLLIERRHLSGTVHSEVAQPALSRGGLAAAIGIASTAVVLLAASAFDIPLGLPTAIAGGVTAAFVLWRKREAPWETLRGVSWLVLPLVAGLFVLVEGLRHTGVLTLLADWLHTQAEHSVRTVAWGAGIGLALVCNIMNNLPAGLIASTTVTAGHLPRPVTDALLVGVDLGPNLSITGSLATILWLTAIRREGEDVTFMAFLARGAIVMPIALLLALAGLLF
jgi:arsenical pump membrane protein